jgi:hypothetical protein
VSAIGAATPRADTPGIYDRHSHLAKCTDKKENQIFLIFKEIQNGAVAKSYVGKYLRIPRKLGSPSSYMTLQLLQSEFPYR